MSKICRTCLQAVADNDFVYLSDDARIKEQLAVCIPELLPDLVSEPLICSLCLLKLRVAYNFILSCMKTEHLVLNFRHRVHGHVDLYTLLQQHAYSFNRNVDVEEPKVCLPPSKEQTKVDNDTSTGDDYGTNTCEIAVTNNVQRHVSIGSNSISLPECTVILNRIPNHIIQKLVKRQNARKRLLAIWQHRRYCKKIKHRKHLADARRKANRGAKK